MAKKTPIWEPKDKYLTEFENSIPSLSEEMKLQGAPHEIPATSGIFGGEANESVVNYKKALAESVLRYGNRNAWITFGTDRPAGDASGYGGPGARNASRIDIVVGRMASNPQPTGAQVDNSFIADAARIYLSQATNLDEYFGIADGAAGQVNSSDIDGHSGIGIKADAVRVIGREGIKLVTGFSTSHDEKNSRGGNITRANPPIELISGNNTGTFPMPHFELPFPGVRMEQINYLQPVAMGENVREAFLELSGIIDKMWNALMSSMIQQNLMNTTIGANAAAIGRLSGIPPMAGMTTMIYARNQSRMYKAKATKVLWEQYFLKPWAYRYVCSRNVFAT